MNHEKNKRSIKDIISNKLAIYATGSIIMAMGVTSISCSPYHTIIRNGNKICVEKYCAEYDTKERCGYMDRDHCLEYERSEYTNLCSSEYKCENVTFCKEYDTKTVSLEKCL